MSGATGLGEISRELVRNAQKGDRSALRALVTRAYPIVRRWALVRTGDPTEAEDLTQDVIVQVIRRLESYRGTARFATWLYALTRNAAIDRRRREERRVRVPAGPAWVEELAPERPEPADEALDRKLLGALVRTFFRELPERQREVFDLADLQGLSSPEIAEMLGIEPVSVRAHLFKARRTLRKRILESHADLIEDFR